MATRIQRVKPLTVTETQRGLLLARTGPGDKLDSPQELVTTKDHLRLWRSDTCLGPAVWLGDVGSEAEMLALHATHPRGCYPVGDQCRRTDTGIVMQVIEGHGTSVTDWIATAAPAATWGGIAGSIDDQPDLGAVVAGLSARINAKPNAPANAVTLGKISEANGQPLWNDLPWPGGGGAATDPLWKLPCIQGWYGPEISPIGLGGACSNGEGVAAWHDSSRFARAMTQAASASRPLYVADWQNGLGAIAIASGTARKLTAAVNTYVSGIVGDCTLWVVAQRGSGTGLSFYCGSTEASRISLYWETGKFRFIAGSGYADFTYAASGSAMVIRASLRGSTFGLAVNGAVLTPTPTVGAQSTSSWTNAIGAYYTGQACDVTIGSYILADGSLSATQAAAIDSYLGGLWAL